MAASMSATHGSNPNRVVNSALPYPPIAMNVV